MEGMHHVVDSCPGYEIDGRGMVSLSQNSYFNPNDTTQSENTNNTFFNMAADRNARKSYDSLPSASRNSLSYDSSRPSHRSSSLAENLRPHPPSPRAHRQPSLSQAAVMELLNHPSNLRSSNPLFAGRDWREIRVGELVSREDVRIVERDTPVEEATKLLIEAGPPNVVLVRSSSTDEAVCSTFDYSDLLAYLLVVLGIATPNEEEVDTFSEIARRAAEGSKIPLGDILTLARKEVVTLSANVDLSKAIQHFGSGVHRIIILQNGQIVGVLSQLKLVRFLWENASSFPVLDQLYPISLRELNVGSHQIISINGDKPLIDALRLMNSEGLTSVAVVDAASNVIGNISTVDVKLLTKSSSLPLLKSSCIHFISVILNERGVENGQDSYPVFYVNTTQSLSQIVAKVVATRAHRLWIVDASSPASSAPPTPVMTPAVPILSGSPSTSSALGPYTSPTASSLQSTPISGRLSGVISLTDILNCFGRQSGLQISDPNEQRERRRRSSSMSVRPSMESLRRSTDSRR